MKIATTAATALLTSTLLAMALGVGTFGCTGEAGEAQSAPEAPSDLRATGSELQALGVHYVEAHGSSENGTYTFFDESKNVIGGGRVTTKEDTLSEINWKGALWVVGTPDEQGKVLLEKDGQRMTEADAAAFGPKFDEAERVLNLSQEQANLPSKTASAQGCKKKGGWCSYAGQNCCAGSSACKKKGFFLWSHKECVR